MRRSASVLVLVASLLAAACSSAPASSASHARPPRAGQPTEPAAAASGFTLWSTYHRTASRAGRTSAVGSPLHRAWTKGLGDAVYGEPLVVGDTLIAATEGDRVFGLDARTGTVRWKTALGTPQPQRGLPCGDIDPLGITGTPAYDRSTGSVFVAAETVGGHHTLWALSAADGHRRWHRSLDVLPHRDRKAGQQRAALLVTHGRVIVSFGGLAGDCGNYVGYITSTPVGGRGATYRYAVPTARMAGMWATPGPGLGRNGHVYVSSGNGAATSGRWDRSDSVTELSPVRMHRVSVFAPKTWPQDNREDLDLGSMSPAMLPGIRRIVIAGKRGTVYLLHERFGGVGSAISKTSGCHAFGGSAVVGRTVLMPCLFDREVRALRVGRSSLRWGWTAHGLYGSPVVAGSRVYVADRYSGDLFVLGLRHGQVIQRLHAGSLTHFPSQVVDGGYVFVPTLSGITAFRG